MMIEISDEEAPVVVNLIARGASHVGAEIANKHLDALAAGAVDMLAVAQSFSQRIVTAQQYRKSNGRAEQGVVVDG